MTGASMRPRHKAAENPVLRRNGRQRTDASMRPRHKAAENVDRGATRVADGRGFNEAAA